MEENKNKTPIKEMDDTFKGLNKEKAEAINNDPTEILYTEISDDKNEKLVAYNMYTSEFYAGFWLRFFAFLLDLLVVGAVSRIVLGLISLFGLGDFSQLTYKVLGLVIYLTYFALFTYLTNGQTIGKMVFGLRVVSFTEEKLSIGTVITREVFSRIILNAFLLLYLVVAFTPKKQGIADLLSDTGVINQKYVELSKLNYNL